MEPGMQESLMVEKRKWWGRLAVVRRDFNIGIKLIKNISTVNGCFSELY